MSYRVAVYFNGPKSAWSKKLEDHEIIFECECPALWMARMAARSHLGTTGRCGYAILKDDVLIEHREAARKYAS